MPDYYHRHLPHWQPDHRQLFITWRLHGSLPANHRPPEKLLPAGEQFAAYDRQLDSARTGPMWLKDPRISALALKSLRQAHASKLFSLHAYVLMSNHVHVLISPVAPLAQITQQIKGATARQANQILRLTGQRFWQDESFDHWVRSPAEGEKIRRYIERNPVAAGLVASPEDWPWSSASNPIL